MKVFFTCSYSGKDKYQKYYDTVLKAIQKLPVTLISTETGSYLHLMPKKKGVKSPTHVHYTAVRRAIYESDVVIIDNSNESFRLGHEATLALQQNKPVLVLSVGRDMSNYIKHKNFFGARYTKYTISQIIKNFITEASKKLLSVRFNAFISEEQKVYLEKQANADGLTQSEYLRKLIDQDRT